jgi:hypothetical protein
MRGMIGMLWETSLLDPEEVILHSSPSWCYFSSVVPVNVNSMSKCDQSSRIKYCMHMELIFLIRVYYGRFTRIL